MESIDSFTMYRSHTISKVLYKFEMSILYKVDFMIILNFANSTRYCLQSYVIIHDHVVMTSSYHLAQFFQNVTESLK